MLEAEVWFALKRIKDDIDVGTICLGYFGTGATPSQV
jgi:hypothetical protein